MSSKLLSPALVLQKCPKALLPSVLTQLQAPEPGRPNVELLNGPPIAGSELSRDVGKA